MLPVLALSRGSEAAPLTPKKVTAGRPALYTHADKTIISVTKRPLLSCFRAYVTLRRSVNYFLIRDYS